MDFLASSKMGHQIRDRYAMCITESTVWNKKRIIISGVTGPITLLRVRLWMMHLSRDNTF